jgi:hypothetical protein
MKSLIDDINLTENERNPDQTEMECKEKSRSKNLENEFPTSMVLNLKVPLSS